MQTNQAETNSKNREHASLKVKVETRDRVFHEIDRLNEKEFGRKVNPDDVVAIAIGLLKSEHYQQIQDATLSNFDRLERDHKAYEAKHGAISKDDYLGKILSGEIEK